MRNVQKYHASMRCAYDIIETEKSDIISKTAMLKIAFKVIYSIANFDAWIITLLIFVAYFCIVVYILL